MKYIISLLFGIVVGTIFIEYIKYKNLREEYEKLLREKKQYQKNDNGEKLKEQADNIKQNLEKYKQELEEKENLISEFRIKLLTKDTESANNKEMYEKEKLQKEKIINLLNLNLESVAKLLNFYEEIKIKKPNKYISDNLFNRFISDIVYYLYLFREFENDLQKFDEFVNRWKRVSTLIWFKRTELMLLDTAGMNYTYKSLVEFTNQGIYFSISDLATYIILHPYFWRLLNKIYFYKLTPKNKIKIVSFLKMLNIQPHIYQFQSRVTKANLVYRFTKLIFSILPQSDDEILYKFWIFLAVTPTGIPKFDISTYPVTKEEAILNVKRYYSNLLNLSQEQAMKITPYIRAFVYDSAEDLRRIEIKEYKIDWLKNFYINTQKLYYITLHQIVLEEKVKQYLDNDQLYKITNRIIESAPLFFTSSN